MRIISNSLAPEGAILELKGITGSVVQPAKAKKKKKSCIGVTCPTLKFGPTQDLKKQKHKTKQNKRKKKQKEREKTKQKKKIKENGQEKKKKEKGKTKEKTYIYK